MFACLLTYGQKDFTVSKISKSTNSIVKEIEIGGMVQGAAVGYAGTRPKQYDYFQKLIKKATTDELKELTNHPNPAVRCYSFLALSFDHSVDLYPILLNHINDTAMVEKQGGCIVWSEKVGDYFINVASQDYDYPKSKKLDSLQLNSLDSILISKHSSLDALSKAVMRVKKSEDSYLLIKKLVLEYKDQSALVKLAEYQKVEDVKLILSSKDDSEYKEGGYFYMYRAISKFPHEGFLPLLTENLHKTFDNTHFSNEWKELYKAIASYKNDAAVSLFEESFVSVKHDNMKTYHSNFIFEAIRKYKDPIYGHLYLKLWDEEGEITSDVFDYLNKIDSSKILELSKKSLSNDKWHYSSNVLSELYDKENPSINITTRMLNMVILYDKEHALKLISERIKKANVHQFSNYASKAKELQESSFIEPLFERLETEWNAHVYLKVLKVLLSYHDDQINKRILKTREINPKLSEGWGGESFDDVLKLNGLQ